MARKPTSGKPTGGSKPAAGKAPVVKPAVPVQQAAPVTGSLPGGFQVLRMEDLPPEQKHLEHTITYLGDPHRVKFAKVKEDGSVELIWQAQAGMQQRVFEYGGEATDCSEILVGGKRGGGKGSPLSAQVSTPFGMTAMGSIRVGSLVSNPDGTVAKVIAVYPLGERKLYEFTFSDGAKTRVTDDHMWLVHRTNSLIKADRRYLPFDDEDRVPYRVWTTAQIIQSLDRQEDKTWREYAKNCLIPLTRPVQFTVADWNRNAPAIDPYFVGVILGDGSVTQGTIKFSTADEEILGDFRIRLGLDVRTSPTKRVDHHISGSGLMAVLRSIGVQGKRAYEKEIPEVFKSAPVDVRYEIVRGLMDTDGTVDNRGHVSYCSTSQKLALDMQWMLRSLGYKATISEKPAGYRKDTGEYVECRTAYELYIGGGDRRELFRLSRKRKLCRDGFNGYRDGQAHRRIVNIEQKGVEEAQCIAVDHPNQLYVTDDFVVTHNTDAAIAWLAEPVTNPAYRGILLRFSAEALKETIDRCHKIYGGLGAVAKNRPPEFHFPSGAIIYTGHFKDERSFEDYRGNEYARIVLEEAGQIGDPNLYKMLLTSNRTSSGLKPRILLTANPDGPGNQWLKDRFVRPRSNATKLHLTTPPEVVDEIRRTHRVPPNTVFRVPLNEAGDLSRWRAFLPGGRGDNPILEKLNPEYWAQMAELPEHIRRAWVDGDWDAGSSLFFPEWRPIGPVSAEEQEKFPWARHVIVHRPIPRWCHRWAAADVGYNHHSAFYWGSYTDQGRTEVYREMVVRKTDFVEMGAEFAKRTLPDLEGLEDAHLNLHLSHEIFSRTTGERTGADLLRQGIESILGPGSAFVMRKLEEEVEMQSAEEALESMLKRRAELGDRLKITLVPVRSGQGARVNGWNQVRAMFRWKRITETVKPSEKYMAELAAAPNGHIKLQEYLEMFGKQDAEVLPQVQIHDCCRVLIDTIPKARPDPKKLEDIEKFHSSDDTIGDDPLEAFRNLCMAFKLIEHQKPYGLRLAEEIQRWVPPDADLNLKVQAAIIAEKKLKGSDRKPVEMYLGAESMPRDPFDPGVFAEQFNSGVELWG